MDPRNPVERTDGALQPYRHHAQLGGEHVRQVAQVEVRTGLQDENHRQTAGPIHRPHPPSLVHVDVRIIRGSARRALGGILALAGRLHGGRFFQCLDFQVALKRERWPCSKIRELATGFRHAQTLAETRPGCPSPAVRHGEAHGLRGNPPSGTEYPCRLSTAAVLFPAVRLRPTIRFSSGFSSGSLRGACLLRMRLVRVAGLHHYSSCRPPGTHDHEVRRSTVDPSKPEGGRPVPGRLTASAPVAADRQRFT